MSGSAMTRTGRPAVPERKIPRTGEARPTGSAAVARRWLLRRLALADDSALLLDAEDVGLLLGISRSMVLKLNASGQLPLPVRLGRCARWRRRELTEWVDAGCPSRAQWQQTRG